MCGCTFPKELSSDLQEDPMPPFPGFCPCLHPPLRPGHCDGCRGPCQHLLQTLLLLRHRDEPHRSKGARALERDDEQNVSLTLHLILQKKKKPPGVLSGQEVDFLAETARLFPGARAGDQRGLLRDLSHSRHVLLPIRVLLA